MNFHEECKKITKRLENYKIPLLFSDDEIETIYFTLQHYHYDPAIYDSGFIDDVEKLIDKIKHYLIEGLK